MKANWWNGERGKQTRHVIRLQPSMADVSRSAGWESNSHIYTDTECVCECVGNLTFRDCSREIKFAIDWMDEKVKSLYVYVYSNVVYIHTVVRMYVYGALYRTALGGRIIRSVLGWQCRGLYRWKVSLSCQWTETALACCVCVCVVRLVARNAIHTYTYVYRCVW